MARIPMIAVAGAILLALLRPAQADPVKDALERYRAEGVASFDTQAGTRRWSENFTDAKTGQSISCASCRRGYGATIPRSAP
ncbi:MAG: hypothetical protein WCZ87_07910 [Thiohalobacteraceae bacterium]